ncbi:hypothetical protein MGWOODY_Smn1408 [hydrothermal vent metagenome]|uniref:Uncharacterized protein n=1 Tax=hydrothermal vent metagenome TaxID=652676 RepID=A0A160THM4_9ZZZZ
MRMRRVARALARGGGLGKGGGDRNCGSLLSPLSSRPAPPRPDRFR